MLGEYITTKHVRNSPVTFVTHKRFDVLFFLPSCCVNSQLSRADVSPKAREILRPEVQFHLHSNHVAWQHDTTRGPKACKFLDWSIETNVFSVGFLLKARQQIYIFFIVYNNLNQEIMISVV